jgi:hypothetical protein
VKKFVLANIVLSFCSVGLAQLPGVQSLEQNSAVAIKKQGIDAAPRSPLADPGCSFLFTSGANNTFLSYCLTSNGNVTQLITPAGRFEIEVPVEGYGICDGFTGTEYFDYAFEDSLNWASTTATRLSPTSMKFVRATSDGVWTLTQTITQVATNSSVKVAMALKNTTADNRPVELLRYVDVDGVLTNNFDGTLNSAMAWNSFFTGGTHPFGLVMQNVGTTTFDYNGFAQTIPGIVHPCNPFANASRTVEVGVDGSLVMAYQGVMPKKSSKTFTISYKGL